MKIDDNSHIDVSNVTICSNIALTPEHIFNDENYKEYDIRKYNDNKEWKKKLPGDLYADLFPEDTDLRIRDKNMTPKQIKESETYHPCSICGKRSAGTCECKIRTITE